MDQGHPRAGGDPELRHATGRFAVFEAKGGFTQKSLSALKVDTQGIRQGSLDYIQTRLKRYLRHGDGANVQTARDLQQAVKDNFLDSFASLYGSKKTYQLPLNGAGIQPATIVP